MAAVPHRLPTPDLPRPRGEPEPTLRAILDASLDAFMLIDAGSRIRIWNRRAAEMFGWTEAEVVGRPLAETILPEESRALEDLCDFVSRRVEVGARHRDGRDFPVELAIVAVEHAKEAMFAVCVRDISARREIEGQLEFQSTILQNMRDSIIVTDPAGRVRFWNQGAEALFGYAATEMVGQSIAVLYPSTDEAQQHLPSDLERALQGGGASGEWQRRRKDGSLVWVNSKRVVLRDRDGSVIGVLALARDVSERVRVSQELQTSHEQLRELARRLRSVREQERAVMARQIHDELGQALSALHLDVAWLRARLAGDPLLEEKARSMAALIETSIGRVRTLATELRPAVLDSLGLLAAIEWETQQFTRRTEIPCTLELPPDPPPVDADRSTDVFRSLQEALTNVARHARAHHVIVRLEARRGELQLSVQDDGRGITAAEIASPQALGLVGMRERALLWDGVVEWRAREGGGTVVELRLPLTEGRRRGGIA